MEVGPESVTIGSFGAFFSLHWLRPHSPAGRGRRVREETAHPRQEEEAGWERMSVAQGAWHWERNMMRRIAREKLERAAARRLAKRWEAFAKGPLPKGVIEVHKTEKEREGGQQGQTRPRSEEEEEFRE